MSRHFLVAAFLPFLAASQSPAPLLSWFVNTSSGEYALSLDQSGWFASPTPASPPTLCVGGVAQPLVFRSALPATGADAFGAWVGTSVTRSTSDGTRIVETFKTYASSPSILVATASFPDGVDADGGAACGGVAGTRTTFPVFDTSAASAPSLGYVSWRGAALGTTEFAVGLNNLEQGSLDHGPVVAFLPPFPGVPHPGLVWSTLDSHKIVTQVTSASTSGDVAGALTALWSAERADQVACLSDLCASDQVSQGDYITQRVEGFGIKAVANGATTVCFNNATMNVKPLAFAWNSEAYDNWVGAPGSEPPHYDEMGSNGWVLANPSTGAIPLLSYFKAYNATHTDWAAVASPAGVAWAEGAGYTQSGAIGYVFETAPAPCNAPAAPTYSIGLSAAIPSIPAGWEYSVVFVSSYGGPTAATYVYGDAIRSYKNTTRLPSVTLTNLGYYTDDGAFVLPARDNSARRVTSEHNRTPLPPPPVIQQVLLCLGGI